MATLMIELMVMDPEAARKVDPFLVFGNLEGTTHGVPDCALCHPPGQAYHRAVRRISALYELSFIGLSFLASSIQ